MGNATGLLSMGIGGGYSVVASGYSIDFNGSSTYIYPGTGHTNPNPFSIGCWFKGTGKGPLVTFHAAQTGNGLGSRDRTLYIDTDGKVRFQIYSGAQRSIVSTSAYNDGAWHHAMATLGTTGGMKIYVDGSNVATDATYTSAVSYSGYWRAGAIDLASFPSDPSVDFYTGKIDQVFVNHAELTSTNATDLYNKSVLPSALSTPIICWQLDEGSGTSATDTSGNSNTGTIVSGTYSSDVP